ncbi:MAG: PP2C family serine/threonine-protein phosphatase [Candidatus Baltobacteraceae bacterium]
MAQSLGSGVRAFAVCDGFGAVEGMRVEEATLTQLHAALLKKSRNPRFAAQLERPKVVTKLLISLISRINTQLYLGSASHEDYVTCGASLTFVLLAGERAYLAHLGNTAAYLSRGGYMISLTKDDSCTFDVPAGRAVAVSAHPPILTRALGSAPHVELSVCSFRVSSGDAVVLSNKRLAGFEDRRALSAWLLHGQAPMEFGDRTIAVIPVTTIDRADARILHFASLTVGQIVAGVVFALGMLLIS